MKVLVKYRDFHWDNYQGGSGVNVVLKNVFDVPDDLVVGDIIQHVVLKLKKTVEKTRPFKQDNAAHILSIEYFSSN